MGGGGQDSLRAIKHKISKINKNFKRSCDREGRFGVGSLLLRGWSESAHLGRGLHGS